MSSDRFFSFNKAIVFLGITKEEMIRRIATGDIPAYCKGRKRETIFKEADLIELSDEICPRPASVLITEFLNKHDDITGIRWSPSSGVTTIDVLFAGEADFVRYPRMDAYPESRWGAIGHFKHKLWYASDKILLRDSKCAITINKRDKMYGFGVPIKKRKMKYG